MLYPLLSVNFIGTLGFSIVLPFLVFLVTRLGGNALIYGILGATYSACQLVGAPILGRWSDRRGRKKVLLVSQAGTMLSWAVFLGALLLPATPLLSVDSSVFGAFTLTVPLVVLFLARALDGLTGGNVSVANAYLADITDAKDRSANFGKMAVSSNLGFIVGPALAGVLGATQFGETLPVLAALTISFAATMIIALLLPESRPCVLAASPEQTNVRKMLGQEQRDCFEVTNPRQLSAGDILRLPSVGLLLSVHFLVFLAFNFFYITFPIHAVTGLRWSIVETGAFFSVMGLLMATVQGPLLSYLSNRWSDRTLLVSGSFLLAVSFMFFVSPNTLMIYLGTGFLAAGNGVMWPSLLAIISKATNPDTQGAVQGFAGSSGAVASIVGLLVGGLLYEVVGTWVFGLSAGVTLAVVAVSLTLGKDL